MIFHHSRSLTGYLVHSYLRNYVSFQVFKHILIITFWLIFFFLDFNFLNSSFVNPPFLKFLSVYSLPVFELCLLDSVTAILNDIFESVSMLDCKWQSDKFLLIFFTKSKKLNFTLFCTFCYNFRTTIDTETYDTKN